MGDAIVSSKGALYVEDSSGFQAGAGTIAASAGAVAVAGTGTAFDSELSVGDLIYHAGSNQLRMVASIGSATALDVDTNWTTTIAAGQSFTFIEPEIVPDVTNINLPNFSATQIDTSVLDTSGFRRQTSGLVNPGSIDGTIFFQPQLAEHRRLYDKTDGTGIKLGWIIWIPDASDGTAIPDQKNSRFYFRGSMNQFGGDMPLDAAISVEFSILIDGKPVLVGGS